MPSFHDYTIGWLCAVGRESVAARVFLDEEHEKPDSLPAKDDNTYTLGRVGKHNVVIAALPRGEYGLVNAANAAKDMIRSFPNLRAGFMVGIGGGAPAKHDIRLGDIVVSSAGSGIGGVYQFDFGKTIQNKEFVATGFLNKPPAFIMTAVSALEATYAIEGHQLKEAVASILDKYPRLRKDYRRPSISTDRLYKADVLHSPHEDCMLYCGDDTSSLIAREVRSEYEDDPAIYYGLVASSNQVIRDALIRDKLSIEKDVLCFEMEAAGLMNQFPFLIVRGICDYSDTHKNKLWQGYAAMTAAAYTKDLLRNIVPSRVEAERTLVGILSDVSINIESINEGITHTKRYLERKEDTEVLDWLTSTNHGAQQTDNLRRRQPGTGQWLLDSEKYQTWLREPQTTLFCPGIPGAGKTILTSIVVDDLENRFRSETTASAVVAYVYCNYKVQNEQTPEGLLSSLLKQLAQTEPSLPRSCQELYGQHKSKRTRPTLDEILKTLESITAQKSRIFIIVDALDECPTLDGCRTKFLSALLTLQENSGINIFATSRPIPRIINHFRENLSTLEIRATKDDIGRYLQGHLSELPKFIANRPDLQDEITTSITEAVDGMFLLAQLHFASLLGKDTPKAIRTALQKLATGSNTYESAYGNAMERIQEQIPEQAKRAKQVLLWITCASRPLTKLELQNALAVEPDEPEFDEDNLPQIEDVLSVCAGLVTVDTDSSIVRLVHYTTQEYFDRTQSKWFPEAHHSITLACFTYLSYPDFESGHSPTDRGFEQRLWLYPFYDYAARNWAHHSRIASACQDTISFLRKPGQVEAASQVLIITYEDPIYRFEGWSQRIPKQMTGLHLAAYFGLEEVVASLLEDWEPDLRDEHGQTPLSWAAERGHEAVVRLLLANGRVDPDSKDTKYGQTPLSWAAESGYEAVVRLLLANGRVDPDSKDTKYGQTPLSWAAESGHEAIVRLLLANERVDPDSKDTHGRTPLSWAARRGNEAVVRLLLKAGADTDTFDVDGVTAIEHVIRKGHSAVEQLLLQSGASISDDVYGIRRLFFGGIRGLRVTKYTEIQYHSNTQLYIIRHGASTST
ncbi:hypothetical protein F4808DRAFT_305556 [Astrocystis sublimbata]|nr:hypothetical protein F4808DRAFT_305556 [Astrocystis sublimbata]